MTTTLVHTREQVDAFKLGRDDALNGRAPRYTYLADLDLYARSDIVSGYVDGFESVTDPV